MRRPAARHGVLRDAKPGDAAAIARVQAASWRETYPGLLPGSAIAARDVEERTRAWTRILREGGDHVVAEADGGVVGFASVGPSREPGLTFEGEP